MVSGRVLVAKEVALAKQTRRLTKINRTKKASWKKTQPLHSIPLTTSVGLLVGCLVGFVVGIFVGAGVHVPCSAHGDEGIVIRTSPEAGKKSSPTPSSSLKIEQSHGYY